MQQGQGIKVYAIARVEFGIRLNPMRVCVPIHRDRER